MEYPLVKLKDVGEFINGKAFKPSEWKDEGTPIVRIQNLNDLNKPYNFFQGKCEERYYLNKGDLLISWSASLGVYIWEGGKAVLNQHIFKVKPDEKVVHKLYLYYALMTRIDEMKTRVHGSTMKHITKGQFERVEIPVPPLEVQKKIVSILQKAEKLKQRRENSNNNSKDIIQSVFYEMFGKDKSKKVKLKDISEIITKGTTPTTYGYEYQENGIPFLRVENISGGRIINSNLKYINEETHNFLRRSKLRKGDVLYTIAGAIGRSAVFDIDSPANINQAVAIIRLKENVDPFFISAFLDGDLTTEEVNKMIVQVAQANLSLTQLGSIEIPLPDISIQKKFSNILKNIENIKQLQKNSTDEINNTFEALMQEIFEE